MAHNVFLSYSRKDKDMMQRLRDGLRAAGVAVWTDDNLRPGTPAWEDAIEKAIESAQCLLVLLSPNSKNSKWVGREITYADNYNVAILPVLISENEKESIPIRLVDYQYASLVGVDFEQFVRELAGVIPQASTGAVPRQERPLTNRSPLDTAPPLRRPIQPGAYQDFLQRYQFNTTAQTRRRWQPRPEDRARPEKQRAADEARRKKEQADAKARIAKIREDLPDAPTIRPWHPIDQLRLAWWLIMDPNQAYIFQYKTPLRIRVWAGAWLLSLVAYLPLLILTVAATVGWLPVEDDLLGVPLVILPIGVMVCWALTGFFATLTDETLMIIIWAGGGVIGIFLIPLLMGGLSFMIAVLAVTILIIGVILLVADLEDMLALGLLVLGISLLGIAGQMLHVDVLDRTLPLVRMERLSKALLLVATVVVAGLWAAIAASPVFEYMTGEHDDSSAGSSDSVADNSAGIWLLGLGIALFISVAVAVGCAVAVKTNADVSGWIADRLPDRVTSISPDIAFSVVGADISFSLADVTHGLIAGWTAALAAVLTATLLLLIGLIPGLIGVEAFDSAIEKRQRSLFGPLAAVLYIAACLILLIVPPLNA